ncbi:hypothetical protein D3C87_1131570 [compost metagenome]
MHVAAQSWVEGADVIVVVVDLDEGLPVAVATVHFHVVEYVVAKIEFRPVEQAAQVVGGIARALEQEAIHVLERKALQVPAWFFRKLRCADQLAAAVVGPAMERADDVAAALAQVALAVAGSRAGSVLAEHERLPMPADVRDQFHAMVGAHQDARVVFMAQRAPVALVGDHAVVADIGRAAPEYAFHFHRKHIVIAITCHR